MALVPQIVCLLACVFCFAALSAAATQDAWQVYRDHVLSIANARFSTVAGRCASLWGTHSSWDRTRTLITTEPIEAMWHEGETLDDVLGYPPLGLDSSETVAVEFSDKTYEQAYKDMIMSIPDRNVATEAFMKFNGANKVYEECSNSETLGQFISRVQQLGSDSPDAYDFYVKSEEQYSAFQTTRKNFDASGKHVSTTISGTNLMTGEAYADTYRVGPDGQPLLHEKISSSGSSTGAAALQKPLVREIRAADAPTSLQDADDLMARSLEASLMKPQSDFSLNGFEQLACIGRSFDQGNSQQEVRFRAKGIVGIPVRPAFLDRALVQRWRGSVSDDQLKQLLSGVPSVAWLSMMPRATIKMSSTRYTDFKSGWDSGSIQGVAVASSMFRNSKAADASALADRTIEEQLADELLAAEGYSMEQLRPPSAMERAMSDHAEFRVREATAEEQAEFDREHEKAMADIQPMYSEAELDRICGKRTVTTTVHEVDFSSNSQYPVLLAVTFDRL